MLKSKAEAWERFGEAALVQMIVDKLPEMAANVAKPLEKTKEMVFVSSDGSGPSQLTGEISRVMAQIPATFHALTGVDIREVIKRKAATIGSADTSQTDLKAVSAAEATGSAALEVHDEAAALEAVALQGLESLSSVSSLQTRMSSDFAAGSKPARH